MNSVIISGKIKGKVNISSPSGGTPYASFSLEVSPNSNSGKHLNQSFSMPVTVIGKQNIELVQSCFPATGCIGLTGSLQISSNPSNPGRFRLLSRKVDFILNS